MSENNPSEPAQQSKRAAREPDELYEKLIEQLSFIDASAKAFDEGHTGEAARLATQIRILVFDGWDKDAKSLLSILGIRESLKYVGTAIDRKLYREALTAHYGHPSISDAMGEVGFLEVLPNDDGSYGLYAPLVEHRYPP